nr:hypothetical protein HK105_005787 [Polyrhizophydium stewartii]
MESCSDVVAVIEEMDDARYATKPSLEHAQAVGHVPEPDGGYGWVVVFASFLANIVVVGLPSSFGVFQQAYQEVPEFAGSSNLVIAFVGSLSSTGIPLFSILAGRFCDTHGPRAAMLIGALFTLIGVVSASFATSIWHLHITQGFLFSIGVSFGYIPSIGILSNWFVKYRGLATGFAVSGAGAGGLAFGPLLRYLLSNVGWRWTLRIAGIGCAVLMLVAALLIRERVKVKTSARIDLSLFKDTLFLRVYAAIVCCSFAYFVPFYFVPLFSSQHGMTKEQGALLTGLLNGASGLGRILLGLSSDFLGPINMLVLCLTTSSLLLLLMWPFSTTFAVLATFVIIYGLFVGALFSLLPTVIAQLFGARGNISTVTGMVFNGFLFGYLLGSPIAGVMADRFTTWLPDGSKYIDFLPSILFPGVCFLLGSIIFSTVRWTAARGKLLVRI